MLFGLGAAWAHFAIDILAIGIIIGFAALAAKRGFVDCFFSLITTVLATLVALLLMRGLVNGTGGLFGLEELLENGCVSALGKIKGFTTDVSNAGLQALLEEQDIPTFLANMVVESVGDAEIPVGTTLAMVVGGPLGRLATSLIAFFILFFVTKLLLSLVKKIFSSIVENIPIVGGLNRVLGFVVGIFQGVLIVSAVIAVLAVIPIEGVIRLFNNCWFVKLLYNHNPINAILGWIIV